MATHEYDLTVVTEMQLQCEQNWVFITPGYMMVHKDRPKEKGDRVVLLRKEGVRTVL